MVTMNLLQLRGEQKKKEPRAKVDSPAMKVFKRCCAGALVLALLIGCGVLIFRPKPDKITLNVYNWGQYISDGQDGTLDVIQYLERIPDKLIPKKQELIDQLRGRIAEGKQANAAAGAALPQPGSPLQGQAPPGEGGPVQGGALSLEKALQGLPTNAEMNFEGLPNIAKKTVAAQGAMRAE
jgi:hypothetical protein